MKPSKYQQRVIDWVRNDADCSSKIVNSVAGSGKSTLLKLCADEISNSNMNVRDCLVLVFNKRNKEVLVNKLNSEWAGSISTIHSIGYRILQKYLNAKGLNVTASKYRDIAKTLDWFDGSNPQQEKQCSLSNFLKLADFVRLTQTYLNPEALSVLIDHYAIDINKKNLNDIGQRISYVFQQGCELAASNRLIDHTDMIWLPCIWQISQRPSFRQFKLVMVDEAQDLSALQLEFIINLTNCQSRLIFVGDPSQSINGFCGADTDSFANIKKRTSAVELVLPVCYRCPKSHIELINRLYPSIPIIPRDSAIPGSIEVIRENDLWNSEKATALRTGDLIIARCSSSLVDLHLKIIVRGISCNLVGSSLKEDLSELISSIAEQPGFDYKEFSKFCSNYLELKCQSFKNNCNQAILQLQLEDLVDAVLKIHRHFSQCKSIPDLLERIDLLFASQDEDGVVLSTIHRAKGMESKRVYIAEPERLPLVWDNQKDWQKQQEDNLLYVALSRSTDTLFLIGKSSWFDTENYEEYSQKNFSSKSSTDSTTDINSPNSLSEIVTQIPNEKLKRLQKLIYQEQGKRIADRFALLVKPED